VYDNWDARIHLIDAGPSHPRAALAGVDWGFTGPGVITVWQEDSDKRLYMVREYYRTHETIDWWLERAKEIKREFNPEAFVCDPSEPGYIKQFIDAGLNAVQGINDIRPGIDAVQQRLQVASDGRARLYIVRDALRERDETLVDERQPFGTVQEFDSYVWPKNIAGKPVKEVPVDAFNHGLDTVRYVVAHRDLADGGLPMQWITNSTDFRKEHLPAPLTDEERAAARLADYLRQNG
jgi:phage terminase large subunit